MKQEYALVHPVLSSARRSKPTKYKGIVIGIVTVDGVLG